MQFILCSGEILLAGRITSAFYKIFTAPSLACRLLFGPRGGFEADVQSIDNDLKYFVTIYYNTIYRGSAEWLPLCLSTVSYLLDIVLLIRACGPAWVVWQFPMERNFGTLGKRIRSISRPHATLVKNITHKCKANVITSFRQQYKPTEWAETAKKSWTALDLARGSLKVPQDGGPDCALLPPKCEPVGLEGPELASMRAVLIQENADEVPLQVWAERYYRAKLASRKNTRSKFVGSDCDKRRRRSFLVPINSGEAFFLLDGSVGESSVPTYGAIQNYEAVFMDDQALAFA